MLANRNNNKRAFLSIEAYEILDEAAGNQCSIQELLDTFEMEEDKSYLFSILEKLLDAEMIQQEAKTNTNIKYETASLILTNRCNLSCIHCCQDAGGDKNTDELGTEEWLCIIDKIKKLKIQTITVTVFIHIGEKGFYYGKNRLMPWIGKTYKFFSGNSSAVPRAAALMNKNICKRYCQPSKLLRKSGILYYRQERQRIIEHQKFTEIMSECRKLWITNGGWKTEEDCIKMIQFVEEGGHIEIDRKTFSTSDFSSYHNFYKKCPTYLARRI